MKVQRLLFVLMVVLFALPSLAADRVKVLALFPGKAMLDINGKRKVLSAGQTGPYDVKLISADSKKAVVLLNGRQETLTMGSSVSSSYTSAPNKELRILADPSGHYFVSGTINGKRARFLLDSGATVVAMSSVEADRLGLNYKDGVAATYGTASGKAQGREIRLRKMSLSNLMLHDVKAVVLPGNAPRHILLGMSALSRLDWSKKGNLFILKEKY